jgi:2-polyprenyl-3-methyl-5-hydroxy-6-metoxy-1,4-benzoquinol methylase
MEYDPIKRSLGSVFNRTPFLRKVFYGLLDLLLLRAWHVHKELKAFSGWKKKGLKVLDGGAGFGQYTFWMSKKNPTWSITAIDVKEEQVADCNEFFGQIGRAENVKFQVGDLTQYIQPITYDLVVCVDVMEHILEDVEVFKNYYTSMKGDAMLLISTPSDQGGSGIDEHSEGEVIGFIDEHVRDGYNIKEIEDKLKSVGFSKVDARYQYGGPGKIAWKLSMMYPMKMLNASKLFFIILPFYYLITYPFSFVLNWLDVSGKHSSGSGLIVKAWK